MSGAMSCHEAREQFSAVLDGALAAGDRSRLEAHLAACVECRHELERFEKTVTLLQAVERARAPVGFVDRVLAAARPTPWYRRALHRAFVPLSVKLPFEAAAVVLIAAVSVYVFRGTPELQRAMSPGHYPPITQESRETGVDKAPPPSAPPAASRRKDPSEERPAVGRAGERDEARKPPSVAGRAPAENAQAEALRLPPSSPPTGGERAPIEAGKSGREERFDAAARPHQAQRETTEEKAARAAAMAKSSAAAPAPTQPEVAGRLSATDRDAATRGLAELITRLGATEIARTVEPSATIVEVLVPHSAYAEFVAGLARLGHWVPEREAAELPAQVRIALRITD